MEATAALNRIRLGIAITDDCPTELHVQKWLDSKPAEGLEIELSTIDSLGDALNLLSEHEIDLIAVEASFWQTNQAMNIEKFIVTTALPRRNENHILVAGDRPGFLPHKSIILASNRLQRRQLRRYRADFRVMNPNAFADSIGMTKPEKLGEVELANWLEDLRSSGTIQGYVARRHIYDQAGIDTRRHKLMTDIRENDSSRFLPVPLEGLTLLISRPGFPTNISDQIGDVESATAWEFEHTFLEAIDQSIQDRVGMIVRHRQINSLLKQAQNEKDLMRSTSLLDPEGDIVDSESMIEVLIEVINKTGERTLLLERLLKMDDANTYIRFMIRDWNTMMSAVTAEHPEDIRLGPARPPFLEP